MSRSRRGPRRLFWIGVVLGVAYALWRWRQRQAAGLGALSPPSAPTVAPPARIDSPATLGAPAQPAAPAAGPRRIPTRVHRGSPPSRPAAPEPQPEPAVEAFAGDVSAGAGVAPAAAEVPAETNTLAPPAEPAEAPPPATLPPAPDGVPEARTVADESSAASYSPGIAPAVTGGEPEVISAGSPDTISEGREPAPPSREAAATGVGLVNINSADEDALVALPGIGRSLARRIIAWREEHGPFASVEALIDIPGIGPRNINDFRAFVTV